MVAIPLKLISRVFSLVQISFFLSNDKMPLPSKQNLTKSAVAGGLAGCIGLENEDLTPLLLIFRGAFRYAILG